MWKGRSLQTCATYITHTDPASIVGQLTFLSDDGPVRQKGADLTWGRSPEAFRCSLVGNGRQGSSSALQDWSKYRPDMGGQTKAWETRRPRCLGTRMGNVTRSLSSLDEKHSWSQCHHRRTVVRFHCCCNSATTGQGDHVGKRRSLSPAVTIRVGLMVVGQEHWFRKLV